MYAFALLTLAVAFVCGNEVGQFEDSDPEYIEMAPYTVVELPEPRPYEKRIYPSLYWVSAKFNNRPESEGFYKLYDYIQGDNKEATKTNMTAPVVVTWKKTDMEMMPLKKNEISFYIPREFQSNPPQPNNPDVFLENGPITLYSWAYGGYSTDKRFLETLAKLESELENDGIMYNSSAVYYATYNDPFQTSGHKNEVWCVE